MFVDKDLVSDQHMEHPKQFFLNLEFRKQIKTIALADESFVSVKTESIREAENICNIRMKIISIWAKNNKIKIDKHK